jgi:malectin (di-glucose binding ER protein)
VRKIIVVLAFLVALCFSKAGMAQQPIRVNCGGSSYTDSKGQWWQADTGFSGGVMETIATRVSGTADPLLYEDYRWNPRSYSIAVPNGQYQVNLFFTEANPKAESVGARVFNVSLQGTTVFPNLDIFAAAGASASLIKSANVNVTASAIRIGFTPVSGLNPKISAIEILPLQTAASPTLLLNFKYPDGTPVTGTLNYSISSSLLSFQGSAPLSNGQAQCVLFTNPSALGISAQFTVHLNLTDSTGHQLWQLSLGMNPAQVNLGAIQTSSLNVVVQKL